MVFTPGGSLSRRSVVTGLSEMGSPRAGMVCPRTALVAWQSQPDWARLAADMDCQPRACLMHASLVALHATCRRCPGGLACLVSLLFPLSLALGLALWMVLAPHCQGRFRFHARDDSLVVSTTRSSRRLDGSQPLGSVRMDGLLTDHGISLAHLGEHATPLVASGPNSLHGRRDHDFLGHGMASLATCMGLCRLRSRSPKPWVWIPDVLLPVVVLGMCHLYGYWRIRATVETRPEQRFLVAAIQPAFPQTLIWESGEGAEKMAVLENLTEAALQTNLDLILWPESALPRQSESGTDL